MALTFKGRGRSEYLQIKQTSGLCHSWMVQDAREKRYGANNARVFDTK